MSRSTYWRDDASQQELYRRLAWTHGPEEAARRMDGASLIANADKASWNRMGALAQPGRITWTATAHRIARLAMQDLIRERYGL